MDNIKLRTMNVLIGALGVGLMIFSIILLTTENKGLIFRSILASVLQADMGLLLLIYGIKENNTKGKPKGNMYFIIGLAILTTTAYTLYDLYLKLAQ